jgi:Kef-type K+ transport system membrane component KefB/mannitol/fructose-specific phosphotransferase system IIA component (Ntr-type)
VIDLPITNPVLVFAVAMGVFLAAPLIFERFRVPGIIGLILIGAAIGPNAANLLARDETIVLLGTVGLLYLMFIAGVEIDLHGFRRYRRRSIVFGSLTFLLPQLIGTAVFLAVFGFGWPAAILIASMFASHTLVAYPVATRLGIAKNEAVTTAVGGTIITDTVALLVLAVVAASVVGDLDAAFWVRLSISLVAYVAVVALLLPRLARWFFRRGGFGPVAEYIFVLAALFLSAWLAEVAGIEAIVGAFFAGLALNRLIPESSPLANRIHFFGNAFFIPFFLVSVGMLVDVRILVGEPAAWGVMAGMTLTVVGTKWLAARATAALVGYSRNASWAMFGLSVPQAAATLAATLIGYEIGLFDDAVLNGSILMILVTCTVGPWVVERFGRRLALEEERRPYRPSGAPQRILIPMANPATAEDLMDLALLVREPGSEEPLYPLVVVPEQGEGPEGRVADAEKALGHAVVYAAGAEVPVSPITRVDRQFAEGIQRAILEKRINTVIVGWDGKRSRRKRMLGTVLDKVLEDTRQLTLVAKLGHPLSTTRRIVLLVPVGSDRHPGFPGAVRTVKKVAHGLGAPVVAATVGTAHEPYVEYFGAVRPDVPTSFRHPGGWPEALRWLEQEVHRDDLVMVLSAREGRVSWSPELADIPGVLAELVPESFVMIYPSLVPESPEAEALRERLDRYLDARGVILDLPALDMRAAVERLLVSGVGDSAVRERALRAVMEGSASGPLPSGGVALSDARVAGLGEPRVLVGVSPEGIRPAGSSEPVHVLVVTLSPAGQVAEQQRLLAAVSALFSDEERVWQLRAAKSPDDIFAWFRTDDEQFIIRDA